jgi:thiamine pyrophosphate-dependent acetolactate synthase large subunit-like protein
MKVGAAVAEILKREGVEVICAYPVNFLVEYAAHAGIRPIIARAERVAGHMADAMSRMSSGKTIGVFAMQHGPGIENAMGAIAQAFGESVPLLVLPMGYPRRLRHTAPNFNPVISLASISKMVEPVLSGADVPAVFRRAFSQLKNGRGGPVVIEIPVDVWGEEVPEPLDYEPRAAARYGPDPANVAAAAELLLASKRPVIYAGQGIHYARAWRQLKQLAELLGAPVATTLNGKSAFPENHSLSLGAGGYTTPKTVHFFMQEASLIFGAGCSFTESGFALPSPRGKTIVHATIDPAHINKDVRSDVALIGDAALTLEALCEAVESRLAAPRSFEAVSREIAEVRAAWMTEWMPKLTSDEKPLTPYRVIWDLLHTVDPANTIITHDAGNPRDQLAPFWPAIEPLSYIGWGKTTQLGYGLGLAMGAKIAKPDKLCINVWGDAAIGFTGMDFETAVRERIPILSILFNNFSMAMELPIMQVSTDRYRSTDISGDYAAMARAFGGYGERITEPKEIIPAIRRGIEQIERQTPALLEFITAKELAVSRFGPHPYAPDPRTP